MPALGRRMDPLVALADLFMGLMASRPHGMSLRDTWVTPATLWLAALFTAVAAAIGITLVVRGGWGSVAGGVVVLGVALLGGSVVAVGVIQRVIASHED